MFPLLTPAFVLRESFRTFRELSEIFSDDNNYSLSRELLVKVGSNSTQKNALAAKKAITLIHLIIISDPELVVTAFSHLQIKHLCLN